MEQTTARERLIVALDMPAPEAALSLVQSLGSSVAFYKIGWRLFLAGGMDFVRRIQGEGKKVFLDLKMDDIGATIETAVSVIAGQVEFLTLFGNAETVRAAVRGRGAQPKPRFLHVTLLSSSSEADLCEMLGVPVPPELGSVINPYVERRARSSVSAGAEGLIVSGESIGLVRAAVGPGPILVCPGIRPLGSDPGDQKRIASPASAILAGADYLVVGRPIWQAPDPRATVDAVVAEIGGALG